MRLRERIGLSPTHQDQLSRLLQLSLVGFLFVGLYELNLGIVVNAFLGIVVTGLPALLERDYQIPMDTGLTLWITGAVFLHTLGTTGLPGMEQSVYQSIWWWDHLTHGLSASIVGGAGYATVRALDEHTEDLAFPPRFAFAFILTLTLAFGVAWEIVEFAIGGLSSIVGVSATLVQFGVHDTLLDLVFDTAGAVIVAAWGTAYLSGVTDALVSRLESRAERFSEGGENS
jgi:hypothetical protein